MLSWNTESIRTYLINLLKQGSAWVDAIFDTGVEYKLTGIIAEGFAKEAYYVDYWAAEGSWEGAQTLETRVGMAKDRAYYPDRRKGASGFVKVSPIDDFTIPSYIYTGPNVPYYERSIFADTDKKVSVFSTETKVFRTGTIIKNLTIAAGSVAVNMGGNKVAIPVTAHGIPAGSAVSISGSDNYDGLYTSLDTSTVNHIHIASAFKAETFIGTEKVSGGYLWIPVKEGVPKEYLFIAAGTVNEVFQLVNENVDNDYIRVFKVDASNNILARVTIVSEQDDLYFQNDPANYYCKITNDNSFTKVLIAFGDDITTKKTQAGDRYLVIYGETTGASGNVSSSGTVNQIGQQPLDVLGNLISFYYRNDYSISGGADWEEQATIKLNAERLFYAGYRPGGVPDYETIIERHPDVQKSKVWSWLDIGDGTLPIQSSERQNEVFITGVTTYGETFSTEIETQLKNVYLKDRDPRDILVFTPLAKLGVKFIIDAYVSNMIKDELEANLVNNLNADFDILNMEFNEDIYSSSYITTIKTSPGILHHTTIAYLVQENEDVQKNFEPIMVSRTSADVSDTSKQIYLSDSTFQIWIRRKIAGVWYDEEQIAQSAGNSITGTGSWDIFGTIDYPFNTITYQLFDLLADVPPSGQPDYAPPWLTGTAYVIGNEVVYLGVRYSCNTDHTSGVFLADIAFWDILGDSVFGIRNPDDTVDTGYIIYLMYRTEDGMGEKKEDLRLASFNQIFDFNSDLLVFNPVYS